MPCSGALYTSSTSFVCLYVGTCQVILYLRPQQLVHLTNTKALVPWYASMSRHTPIPSPHTPRLVPHAMPSHTRRVEQAVAFYPSQCAPLVLVLGLEEYLSKHGGGGGGGRHAQGDKRVLHDMVTDSLAEMLVALGVAWRAVECEDEVVQVILRMARAIAQEPYRDPISVVHLYRDSKASAGRSNSLRYHLLSLFLTCCLAPSLPMTACQEASCALCRCCAMRTVCKWG